MALLELRRSMGLRRFPRLRTYGELVQRTLQTVNHHKRLNADGSEPTTMMHGVTIPRPVHVKLRTRIGKEITVDPTDTDEDYTAEMLSATGVLEYGTPKKSSMPCAQRSRRPGLSGSLVSAVFRARSCKRSSIRERPRTARRS